MQDFLGEMMSADDPNPMADALRRLAPQPAAFSRDALLFAAGKAAGQPRAPAWLWPSATGLFAGATLVLGGFLLTPTPTVSHPVNVPQIVYVDRIIETRVPVTEPVTSPVKADPTPEDASPDAAEARRMWRVRQEVLRWGVEMLPRSNASGGSETTPKDSGRGNYAPPGSFAIPGLPFRKTKPAVSSPDEDIE